MARIIYKDEQGEIVEHELTSDYGDVIIAFEDGFMKINEDRKDFYDYVIPVENLIEMYC